MFVISSRNIRLALLIVLVVLGLACSSGEFVVTLTPTPGKGILSSTMTLIPTVVYPTLLPSSTPTLLPGMVCEPDPVDIICKATVCVVRNDPRSGGSNIAYTLPNNTILKGAFVCICPTCASLEQNWFYLGQSGNEQFWAIGMNQVWELQTGD